MKLRSIFAIGIVALATSATLTGAFAQGIGTPKDGAGRPGKAARAKKNNPLAAGLAAVELTDVQKDAIKTITKKYRDERKTVMESVQPGGGGANKPQAEIRAKLNEIEDKQAVEVKAVLTAEQLPKFQTAYDAVKSERGGGGNLLGGLAEKLSLTDKQKTQIMPIITATGAEMAKVREDDTFGNRDKATKMFALFNEAKAKMRPFLTADQQKTLDEMKAMRGAKHERGGGKPRPDGV